MITAVFDTNVYFQAAVSQAGPAYACWKLVLFGEVEVFITEEILAEVENVLNRS